MLGANLLVSLISAVGYALLLYYDPWIVGKLRSIGVDLPSMGVNFSGSIAPRLRETVEDR